jgi:hypothetical protein
MSYQATDVEVPRNYGDESVEGVRVSKYETSLNIRIDVEAALCYVFGCISGIFFLIMETKNDYVRCNTFIILI